MTRAGTHFLARGTALGLPPWGAGGGGGSTSGGTHPQPIESSTEYQRTSEHPNFAPCAAFPRPSLCAWDFKCSRMALSWSEATMPHLHATCHIVQGPDADVPQRGQKKRTHQ